MKKEIKIDDDKTIVCKIVDGKSFCKVCDGIGYNAECITPDELGRIENIYPSSSTTITFNPYDDAKLDMDIIINPGRQCKFQKETERTYDEWDGSYENKLIYSRIDCRESLDDTVDGILEWLKDDWELDEANNIKRRINDIISTIKEEQREGAEDFAMVAQEHAREVHGETQCRCGLLGCRGGSSCEMRQEMQNR